MPVQLQADAASNAKGSNTVTPNANDAASLKNEFMTLMIAQICELAPGDFVHTFGDAHLYANHLEQADRQLGRMPLPLPTMKLNPVVKDIFGFSFEDFTLCDYQCHGGIKAPIAV